MTSGEYFEHARRQAAAADVAMREFLASLPEAKRAALESVSLNDVRAHDVGLSMDLAESSLCAVGPDVFLDEPADELAERFDLPAAKAAEIAEVIAAQVEAQVAAARSEQLGRVIGMLLRPHQSLPVVIEALAISQGLDELNGVHSQAEVGRRHGVTRALVCHYVAAWSDLLGTDNRKFRRSKETRERNRKARQEVVARG